MYIQNKMDVHDKKDYKANDRLGKTHPVNVKPLIHTHS